jgi:hypothetical protein
VTRRDFIVTSATAAAAGALGFSWSAEALAGRSRVVLVRRKEALREDGRPDAAVLRAMLNEGVAALMHEERAGAAWRRLVGPKDIVGIKSNAWSNLPTPRVLEDALRGEIEAAGVPPANVAVDDRGVLENPVFRRATALVNVRPMRTHHWAGLGTCLKNYIMFVPKPSDYHADACASLGAVWKLPHVAGKTRLNVLVMLTPQFHGVGPHNFSPKFTWPYCGLIVGTDPVAVDATGARIVEAKRRAYFGEERPISPPAHHIRFAEERYGLGTADAARIELVRLGLQEEALV